MKDLLHPLRVYIGRYGHIPDQPLHFHLIPIYRWVEALFWKDRRYRVLEGFGDAALAGTTDGAELTFFVWREFCERPDPPAIEGPTVEQVVAMLAAAFREAPTGPTGPTR
jgi:diadenosine tetraphosphate (Ap4A) HIT family hydrolase